jgi:hypothetical protein
MPTEQDALTARGVPAAQVPLRLKSLAWVPDTLIEEKFKGAVPLFVMVNGRNRLPPSCVLANAKESALAKMLGAGAGLAVPLKLMVLELPAALWLMLTAAVRGEPGAVALKGEKVTCTTQVPPGATEAPVVQVLPVSEYSAGDAPPSATLLSNKGEVPLLVTVACALLLLPTVAVMGKLLLLTL